MRSDPSYREAPDDSAAANVLRPGRIGIFHPADPVGHIPGGIETVIRSILKWAPADLDYTLFGATSDLVRRPVGRGTDISLGDRRVHFLPIVSADPSSTRGAMPLTARFMYALQRYRRTGRLRQLDVLDFHRIEPLALFKNDPRPKNVMIHQDMSAVLRDKNCDIGWRHAPWLYESMERWLLPLADRVFCVRQSAIDRYRKSYTTFADRFEFIPTWVDSKVFYPLNDTERGKLRERIGSTLGIAASTRMLVSVGRLDQQKDPLLLLEALKVAIAAQPNIHLVMVGDGILRPQVEAVCRSKELTGRVSLLGARPPDEIADLLRAADLFVLSSAYEGMPIVVLEALATGLPVVTTNVGEVRLTVQDDVNGAVVIERSPQHLAIVIGNTLARVDSLRGAACVQAVGPYMPEIVLSRIYDNHRRQATRGGA